MKRYCRGRVLAGVRLPDDRERAEVLEEIDTRLALGRCESCACRSHHCEGDECTCPLPRCEERRQWQ